MQESRLVKSIVILPNWVGDTVMALPTLRSLAIARGRVSVLARPHLAPLLASVPGLQVVRRTESTSETVRDLRSGEFDDAVVLPNSFRSAWLPYRANISRRWGYAFRTPEGLLRRTLLSRAVSAAGTGPRHQIEDYRELLAAMDVPAPPDWTPRIDLDHEQRHRGAALLRRAGVDTDRSPLIGLFPGAQFGSSKRWPWQRFAELARLLRRRRPGSQQIIVAGPSEVWLAVRIHEDSGKIHPVVGPDLDLGALATVLARLDLLITNDSGPMHVAAAVGTPCIALFGPTNPARTRPVGPQHRVMYSGRWCSPCFRRRCPLIHHRCLREISAEQITQTVDDLLDA